MAPVELPPITEETKAIVSRANARRLALSGDMAAYRGRVEEVMRWANPPWDPISRRVDPRAELASTARAGENVMHIDLVGPTLTRWSALQAGAMFTFRCKPKYVRPPIDHPDDPQTTLYERKQYDIDRQIAQTNASQIENQTMEWLEANNFHRTLLWAAWAKEAFGKAIIKCGWSDTYEIPTAELMENPAQVYYGWSKRYGLRQLAWVLVIEELSPFEANRRFDLNIPTDRVGSVDMANWAGKLDESDVDYRAEQQQANQQYVIAEEFWELVDGPDGGIQSQYALIIADRVVEGPTRFPWTRLPYHVLENEHLPTYLHGKSTAEVMIPINAAYDEMLDRQHQVIGFESGPRYKGMNMANSGDDVDIPDPFHMVPLREGEDILQIDTRVDFFPTQLHAAELKDAKYKATGLTPIAWGMSPNAQTSGRAMAAEWRAVELPLASKLLEMGPELKQMLASWWDYAEAYVSDYKQVAKGYRRFEILWLPLDIRDKTEKTMDVIQRLNANLLDPETAIEETGYENVDEMVAKIRAYLIDPIWNPLRYQQYLTLQQLELTIRQMQMQVSAQEAQSAQQGGPPTGPEQQGAAAAQQGQVAAGQAAQGPTGPITESQNQPGQTPPTGLSSLPVQTSIMSQTPLQGGIGNRAIVPLGGAGAPAPTNGQVPR